MLWMDSTRNQIYLQLTRLTSLLNLISRCISIRIKQANYKTMIKDVSKPNLTLILLSIKVFLHLLRQYSSNIKASIDKYPMILALCKNQLTNFNIEWSMKTSRDLLNNSTKYLIASPILQWLVSINTFITVIPKTTCTTNHF